MPGFSVHGILQARILEWVAISFSRGSSALQADSGGRTHSVVTQGKAGGAGVKEGIWIKAPGVKSFDNELEIS